MALQSSFYATNGTTRTFPSTKHIATKQHVAVYQKRVSDNVWELAQVTLYDLIGQSVVFDIAPSTSLYSQVEIRIADSASELATSLSEIAVVSGAIANVNTVATNITLVNTVSANISAINNISSVIVPNINEILLADTNAATATAQAVIATTQAGIATTKAAEALVSANAAALSYNSFDDRYLGAKTSDPTLDNDGAALLVGALYFNSTASQMKVWNGAVWGDTSTLTATGVATLANKTISLSNNTFSATSAQLISSISDETGSGSLVFSVSPTLTGTPLVPTAARLTNNTQIASTSYVDGKLPLSGVRQTVQTGLVDANGYANFVSIGTGLAVNIAATAVPLIVSSSGGSIVNDRVGIISANTTIGSLAASNTNYLYADVAVDGGVTLRAGVLAPIYQFGGTPSVTNGQFTFNISEMKGYLGNGTTAPQAYIVYLGEAITNATNVTSVVNYALNGLYDSGYTNTLPAAGTTITRSHNIGVPEFFKCNILVKCLTAQSPYIVGDIVEGAGTGNASWAMQFSYTKNRNSLVTYAMGTTSFYVATGAGLTLTLASWAYKITAKRGW